MVKFPATMKPLVVLLLAFGLALVGAGIFRPATGFVDNFTLAGQLALSAMLVFTAIGHFAFRAGMAKMLPAWLPAKAFWVLASGVFELAVAVGLHVNKWSEGWILTIVALLGFLLLALPLNIMATYKHLDYQRGTFDGPGLRYLWFRIPLQLLFMAWTLHFFIGLPLANLFGTTLWPYSWL